MVISPAGRAGAMARFNPFDAFASSPADRPGAAAAQEPPPRWLTYRCAACGGRVYSGFTSSALERHLAQQPRVPPDFFHADCGVETPLAQADLRFDDGSPWRPR